MNPPDNNPENWEYLHYFSEDNDEDLQRHLAQFCREHSVTCLRSDQNSIRYVCKKKYSQHCGYEMEYFGQQAVIYARGEHNHPVHVEHEQPEMEEDDHERQQENGDEKEAQKIKKSKRGRKGRGDWRYVGQADSIQEVCRKYRNIYKQAFTPKYQYFSCKRRMQIKKCYYVMRWNSETKELHEAERHNHGHGRTAPKAKTAAASTGEKPNEKAKAQPKNDNANAYVDHLGRVWAFFAQIRDGQSDAEIRQFCIEQGCSISNINRNGRAYFLCYIKGCTFKALITRADGRAYRLVDHNHEKRERKIGMQKPKMVAVKRQPMQENDQNKGNGEPNYVDSLGQTWRFMVKLKKNGSEKKLRKFCRRNGCTIKSRENIRIGPVVRMCCLVKNCPFRAVMLNEGRIYSRFEHNHEVKKIKKKKHTKKAKRDTKIAAAPNPFEPAEEEANDDMEIDEDEESQNEDGNVGRKAAEDNAAVLNKRTNSDFLNMVAPDVQALASQLELRFDIENDCLVILQLENRQVGKTLVLYEERNRIRILELMGTEFTGGQENWTKDTGKEQFVEALDNKLRRYFMA